MSAVSSSARPRTPAWYWAALILFFVAMVTVQVLADEATVRAATPSVSWIRSPGLMQRLALNYDALAADVYWVRAVQYYGDTRLSKDTNKNYNLLYPLLDITTTLDPDFRIAYRFGAILLSEGYPGGAGQPDEAIALLEKGMKHAPERWEYPYDAGFVEYWWKQDYPAASAWLIKASKVPGAPNWLPTVAASMLAEGGSRADARQLWTQIGENADQEWLRRAAQRGIAQINAEEAIEALHKVVDRFQQATGQLPQGWPDLIRAGLIRGVPVDPARVPYELDAGTGRIDVAEQSPLYPLRRRTQATAPGR
jgi:hypothetical protein